MNTNDPTPLFPAGRCDLNPLPSRDALVSRIVELEANLATAEYCWSERDQARSKARALVNQVAELTAELERVSDELNYYRSRTAEHQRIHRAPNEADQ